MSQTQPRDWQPGDVARIAVEPDGAIGIWTGRFWAWSNGNGPYEGVSHCHEGIPTRPLVVIDPEDLAQVERLWDSIMGRTGLHDLADALREFANPTPPIEEPADPAVRIAAGGTTWAKVGRWWVSPDMGQVPREWDWLTEQDDFTGVPA